METSFIDKITHALLDYRTGKVTPLGSTETNAMTIAEHYEVGRRMAGFANLDLEKLYLAFLLYSIVLTYSTKMARPMYTSVSFYFCPSLPPSLPPCLPAPLPPCLPFPLPLRDFPRGDPVCFVLRN